MTLTYEHTAGRVVAKKDGVAFFDTDAYPVQIGNDASVIAITGQVITFPDLMKGDAYAFARGLIGSSMYRSCHSFVTLGGQEWGPPTAIPPPDSGRELADVVLGTVPPGVDAIYVRVKLSRTTVPSQINGVTIPTLFEEGVWVNAPGGSLPMEYLGIVSRQIDIRLQVDSAGAPVYNVDGTRNIVLQRRQSVKRMRYGFWRSGNDPDNSGWTYGGSAGPGGHIVSSIQQRGPDFTVGDGSDYSRTGGLHCSLVDTTNYSSVYTGDIEVYPISTNVEPTSSAASVKSLLLTAQDIQGGATARSTFLFEDIPVGSPHATRYVYVGLWCFRSAGAVSLTTVRFKDPTTGSVIADLTPVVTASISSDIRVYAIYRVALPTADSLVDLEVIPSASAQSIGMASWVAYNLAAPTSPVATINTGQYGGSSWTGVAVSAIANDSLALFFAASAGRGTPYNPDAGNQYLSLSLGVDDPEELLPGILGANDGGIQQVGVSHPTASSFQLRWYHDTDLSGSTNFTHPSARCVGLVLT